MNDTESERKEEEDNAVREFHFVDDHEGGKNEAFWVEGWLMVFLQVSPPTRDGTGSSIKQIKQMIVLPIQ